MLWTFTSEYSTKEHLEGANSEGLVILDNATEPLFVIADMRDYHITMDEMLFGANYGARGSSSTWRHPNIRETAVVSSNSIMQAVIKGLDSATFGHMKVKVFPTVDEALSYVRSKLAE